MKTPRLPSRSSLLSIVLSLTLGLSAAALATYESGYDIGAACTNAYGYGTPQWTNCIIGECWRFHNYAPIDDPDVQACIAKARKRPIPVALDDDIVVA